MDLDVGAERVFNENLVPDELKHLLPVVRRWAFEQLTEQDKFVKAMKKYRPDEVKAFSVLYDQNRDAISRWLRSLPIVPVSEMKEEDWHHPQWAFGSLYKIRELTGPGIMSEGELDAIKRWRKELRLRDYAQSTAAADEAFRSKEYATYVQLLAPFKDLLTVAQQKKLELASKMS